MRSKKLIANFFIAAGIIILCIPFLKESRRSLEQRALLEQWKEVAETVSQEEAADTEKGAPEQGSAEAEQDSDVVAVLKIESIHLEQPVLKEASKKNLDISLATIEPTGTPGEIGNFVISGHNSRTYERHFNRLSEVEIGDTIQVLVKDAIYCYSVTEILIVEEDEVWVLEGKGTDSEITLITCYYPKQGKVQRLVVKGTLVC